jgi:hypothetical protein
MRYTCTSLKLFALMLFFSLTVFAQSASDAKHFSKDGLVFDYPGSYTLKDLSNEDAQQLTLERADSDAQIRIFVFRSPMDTPEKIAEARTKLVDPYIEATSKSLVEAGGKPTRAPATLEIGGAKAEGVRISAVLDSVPGEAAIYWITTGNRLVVLTLFGPDQGLKQMAPAWNAMRTSLRVEAAKPAVK